MRHDDDRQPSPSIYREYNRYDFREVGSWKDYIFQERVGVRGSNVCCDRGCAQCSQWDYNGRHSPSCCNGGICVGRDVFEAEKSRMLALELNDKAQREKAEREAAEQQKVADEAKQLAELQARNKPKIRKAVRQEATPRRVKKHA